MEEQSGGVDGAESDAAIVVNLGDNGGTWKWLEFPTRGTVAVIVDDPANSRGHVSPVDWNAVGETRRPSHESI